MGSSGLLSEGQVTQLRRGGLLVDRVGQPERVVAADALRHGRVHECLEAVEPEALEHGAHGLGIGSDAWRSAKGSAPVAFRSVTDLPARCRCPEARAPWAGLEHMTTARPI